MDKIEITNDMIERAEERLYNMEDSAKRAFDELFPNLDFEKDFMQNENFTDIQYLFDIVDRAVDEKGFEHYGALYKLLDWTLEGMAHRIIREHCIETIRNFDEKEIEEFISWLQEEGLSYEDAQDPEYQIELLGAFLDKGRR